MRALQVLCVSYDVALLATRRMLLERDGHKVTPSASLKEALEQCRSHQFDLFILGYPMPATDKDQLMKVFRAHCGAPILSLQVPGEEKAPDADYYAFSPGPEEWLQLVAGILGKRARVDASGPAPPAKRPPTSVSTKTRNRPRSA